MTCDISTSFPLRPDRMHEVCGPGAQSFAVICAAHAGAVFLWIRESWRSEQLNPAGFMDFFPPENLLVATAGNQTEVLATAEESLRSGVFPLVIMELSGPLDLTSGRRLQLAAKAGKTTALAIIPDGMGSNAAETRWWCTPVFDQNDSTLQRWKLIKNKSGTLGVWNVRWSQSTRRIAVVSEARF
ncbi:hypothetical protein [uncultured Roseobacter sp.]|uniref:ImuA family protein n=1 Tax=uncultured Roseobacter sp. TaxID=114847 RepID=UPI0026179FCB|nr:hypothetical protein [uncultured Roseobacter sp.]